VNCRSAQARFGTSCAVSSVKQAPCYVTEVKLGVISRLLRSAVILFAQFNREDAILRDHSGKEL
jgi:hypothetical protein